MTINSKCLLYVCLIEIFYSDNFFSLIHRASLSPSTGKDDNLPLFQAGMAQFWGFEVIFSKTHCCSMICN